MTYATLYCLVLLRNLKNSLQKASRMNMDELDEANIANCLRNVTEP